MHIVGIILEAFGYGSQLIVGFRWNKGRGRIEENQGCSSEW